VRRHALLSCVAATAALLCARPALAVDRAQPLDELEHTVFTPREGAPPGITSLAQSRDGFLWIATTTGLFTFDGARFVRFRPADGAALPDEDITVMKADPSGGIWAGTRFGYVYAIRGGQVRRYDGSDGLAAKHSVLGLAIDAQGVAWCGSAYGILRLEGQRWVEVASADGKSVPLRNTDALLADARGQVWALSEAAIFVHRPAARSFEPTRSFRAVNGLILDEAGVAWASTGEGTRPLDDPNGSGGSADPATLLGKGGAGSIGLFDREGSAWGEVGGRYVRLPAAWVKNAAAQPLPVAQTLRPNERQAPVTMLLSFLEDAEGNVWIGTEGGLDRFRSTKFRRLADGGHELGNAAIAAGRDGGLWIMAAPGLLRLEPDGAVTRLPSRDFQRDSGYTHLYAGRDGDAYVGGVRALHRFGPAVSADVPMPSQAPNFVMQAMTEDATGDAWISAVHLGVYRRRNGQWLPGGGIAGVPQQPALMLQSDARGRVWIGYPADMLALVENERARVFGAADGLAVGNVLAVLPADGGAWIGGSKGAAWFDGARFHPILLRDGTAPAGVSGIVATPEGELWLNGRAGVLRIPAPEAERLRRDPQHPVEAETLGIEAGIEGTPPTLRPLPSAARTADGRLWFETSNGLYWIDPKRVARNAVVPHVEIVDVSAGDHHAGAGPLAMLPALTRALRIDYTATSLGAPGRVRFRYRLEGVDAAWQDADDRRQAFYTNLAPGRYDFRVAAANEDGLWNEAGAHVAVEIPAAFWQTRAFALACAAAALAAGWALYLLRLRTLARRAWVRYEDRLRERERIARELHDTLLQGTQGLVLNLQIVAGEMPGADPRRRRLEALLDQADGVIAQARDRVHELRDIGNEGDDLVTVLSAIGADLAASTSTTFELRGAELLPLRADVRSELILVAREALANAFRHAHARRVELEIACEPGGLRLSVRDDGDGIDPRTLADGGRPGHWGLVGMKERADRIGGRLGIHGRPGGGTEIRLELPRRYAFGPRHAGLLAPIQRWLDALRMLPAGGRA
jgi:signal transduction histidine kinase/ligand-binding sensor domain-containing protein